MIKSEHSKIFGGFTSVGWSSDTGFKEDPQAYVFSVDHQQKFNVKDNQSSIYHDEDELISFGYDIEISSECNSNNESNSFFGYNYQLPNDCVVGSKQALSFLAGSENFKVHEIEVFVIV